MAANDYYAAHPQNTTHSYPSVPYYSHVPPDCSTGTTSLGPIPTSEPPHLHPPSLSSSPGTSSRTSSDSHISDRGFLTPSSNQPGLKKSKSDRALNFAKKQVKKQIDKKLHGGNKHGGGHQEVVIEADQGDSTGANGGEYGYGDASGGYGASGGDYGGADSGAGAGEYGYGDSSGGYGMSEGDFGGFGDGGNFDAVGDAAGSAAGDAAGGLSAFFEALGG